MRDKLVAGGFHNSEVGSIDLLFELATLKHEESRLASQRSVLEVDLDVFGNNFLLALVETDSGLGVFETEPQLSEVLLHGSAFATPFEIAVNNDKSLVLLGGNLSEEFHVFDLSNDLLLLLLGWHFSNLIILN